MKKSLILLLSILAAEAAPASEPVGAGAQKQTPGSPGNPGWPQANGPFGNFNPRRYGVNLVDDFSQAKAVWTSEESDLGYAKTSVSGFVGNRAKWPGHPGSANGLIAAEGKIFASSFRPAGDAWAEKHPAAAQMSKFSPEEQKNLRRALSIDADDFVVAIDMATGKTVWKAVEERKGLFRGMGKRGGWGVTPAYHAGRIFSLGTTGRLYCYDAGTGRKVWETDLGKTHQAWEAEKKKNLDEKSLPSGGQQVSLVVADGVLIVPLFDPGTDISLRGVEVQTGKTLWDVPAATAHTATPAPWRHGGREYVLAATHGGGDHRQGKLRLIDPKDGKVLWTVEKLGNTHFSLAPSDAHVLVNVGSKTANRSGDPWMLLGCYRLTMRLWTADAGNLHPLCPAWPPPHTGTTGYNVFIEFPYVYGRLFMRSREGTVRCYDLRKSPND
jgi:outer membrane protein assembly factor BamB